MNFAYAFSSAVCDIVFAGIFILLGIAIRPGRAAHPADLRPAETHFPTSEVDCTEICEML